MCMAELEEPAAARARIYDFAAEGALEQHNPMAEKAAKMVLQNGEDAAARFGEQDTIVEAMRTSAESMATQQKSLLSLVQTNAAQLMSTADVDEGAVTADVDKILQACGDVGFSAWSDKVGAAMKETSEAFQEVVTGDMKKESERNFVAKSKMKERTAAALGASDEERKEALAAVAQQQHKLQASHAKQTALMVTMRTQAYTASLEQLAKFVDAQSSFFEEGLAAMQALAPEVEALKARAAQQTEAAAAMSQQLTTLAEAAEDESAELPALAPLPKARTLRAGVSVLGASLGPPQRAGYLYREGDRRWCVLINGKLYEYADHWEEAPVNSINMFLCNAKPAGAHNNGIELTSMNPADVKPGVPPVPTIYQAESEEEQQDWLKVITACTEFMITHPPGDDDAAVEEDPQVTAVRSVDGNEVCADCSRELPEWVSISLGTTMCSECSGAHRSLGTHISKVQS